MDGRVVHVGREKNPPPPDQDCDSIGTALLDKARQCHSSGAHVLQSVQLGDIPGVAMTIIKGVICCEGSRNTPPVDRLPFRRVQVGF